jgi:hypothetical protein
VGDLTAQGLSYRIDAGPVPPELLESIRKVATSVTASNGSLHLMVPSLEGLNACVDALRGSGHLIRHVSEEKSTLEESFIKILAGEETRP